MNSNTTNDVDEGPSYEGDGTSAKQRSVPKHVSSMNFKGQVNRHNERSTETPVNQLNPEDLSFKDQTRSASRGRNCQLNPDDLSFKDQTRSASRGRNGPNPSPIEIPRRRDDPLISVVAVDQTPRREYSLKRLRLMLLAAVVIVLGIIGGAVGVVFGLQKSDSPTVESGPPPASPPSLSTPPKLITNTQDLYDAVDAYLGDSTSTLQYGPTINDWDVSRVTNFSFVFDACCHTLRNNAAAKFNEDISNWDVASATTMVRMFDGSAFNQNIGKWNVSSVVNMEGLFAASGFNQDISAWDVSSVIDFSAMFWDTFVFNQDISYWNVGNGSNVKWMFAGSDAFNQNLCAWRTKLPVSANTLGMFSGTGFDNIGAAQSCPSVSDPALPNGPLCYVCE